MLFGCRCIQVSGAGTVTVELGMWWVVVVVGVVGSAVGLRVWRV